MKFEAGYAMERAEAEATVHMAQNCREPADYALWQMIGREAVRATRGMTADQRSAFVVMLTHAVSQSARDARMGGGRLQRALDFKIRPEEGFDDEV